MIVRPSVPRAGEAGTALLGVLMVTTLLATLSAAAVLVVMTESMASANHGAAQQALYAADAALEQTLSEVQAADWRTLPGVAVSGRLRGGALTPRAPDGAVLDLAQLAAARQAESDAAFGISPDRPVWRLFGHAPLSDLTPAGAVVPPAYLLVWMADDGDERDGEPGRDSNDVLFVRVEAFGASHAHRSIEATLALQTGPAAESCEAGDGPPPANRREVRVLSWKEVR